jgi:hypothetical protein
MTSEWKNFPFDKMTLSDLFDEATYTKDEVLGIYTLDRNRSNIQVESTMHFTLGRCYTLKPKVTTNLPVS